MRPTVFLGAALIMGSVFASTSYAAVVTCSANGDTGLTYSTTCPATATAGRCIIPGGTLNGCCNKGTCNNSGSCITGPDQDHPCLNDNNQCTADICNQIAGNQGQCTHTPEPSTKACEFDGNPCTSDFCNGSQSSPACVNGGANTCAAEQSSNPAPQCQKWQCDNPVGCHKVPLDPGTQCDDGKDCTTGDQCDANGNCSRGASGTLAPPGSPCRDDDTTHPENRTWCKAGTCDDGVEGCRHVVTLEAGADCDPNPCTTAKCATRGGDCIIDSCNVGASVFCAPCGTTLNCVDGNAGQSANTLGACGCLSNF